MAASPVICFIAGASRGLGLALVREVATRYPTSIIYAGVRDPDNVPGLQTLVASLPQGRVLPVKWVAADAKVNEAVAEVIREKHGHVDVAIANAGIAKSQQLRAADLPIDDFRDMLEVNTIGVLMVFQSLYPLLKASTHPAGAKFIAISSGGGSLTGPWVSQAALTGYGASKAALNYVCRKIHFENEWLISFPLCPGVVDTDMIQEHKGNGGQFEALKVRMKTPEDTARMLLDIIIAAKRETHGGEFVNHTDGRHPW